MDNNIVKIIKLNIKIINIFKHFQVKEENINKYEEEINKYISLDSNKTLKTLNNIWYKYIHGNNYSSHNYSNTGENPNAAQYESLITPVGVILSLAREMPGIIIKQRTIKRKQKYLERISEYNNSIEKEKIKKIDQTHKVIEELYKNE